MGIFPAMILLQQGHVVDDVWGLGLEEWLRRQAGRAWLEPRPVVIVTPDVARAGALRSQLVAHRLPLLGVEFWQPRQLRHYLAQAFGLPLPLEDGRLIEARVRSVARELAEADAGDPVCRAFARSAQALADTLTMLEASGWGDEKIEAQSLRRVAKKFVESNGSIGVTTAGAFDFSLLARADNADPVLASILIAGFDGMHWEHWPILAAAAKLATDAFVTLPIAHDAAGDADMVWCSSWEQLAGKESQLCPNDAAREPLLGRLAEHLDFHSRLVLQKSAGTPVEFVAAENLVEEARALALRTAKKVAEGARSVAVLVPCPGPVAREVSLAFERLGIEHYTTLPGYSSPVPHSGSWPSALEALVQGTTDALCVFLRSNGELPRKYVQDLGANRLADTIERLAAEQLISEIRVLRSVLRARTGEDVSAVGKFLDLWPALPAFAGLGEYLDRLRAFATELGWDEIALSIADAARAHSSALELRLSLDAVHEWLKSTIPGRRVYRTPLNSNPYAKVQVLTPSEAVWCVWDYIVFAGQTEGSWPPPLRPAGYLGEEVVHSLNDQARGLNRTGTEEGIFGDGMMVVRPGKGYCVGPSEQRLLHLRDLLRLICSARCGILFSAALTDETDSGRALQPGDFFRRVYCGITGVVLDAAGLRALMDKAPAPTWQAMPKAANVPTAAVRRAWDARNSGAELTEFEFTLGRDHCGFPVSIPPSDWGVAFEKPAEVFLKAYLGVRAPRDGRALPMRAALGIWAHRFVESAAKTAKPGNAAEWEGAASSAAEAHLANMVQALAEHGRQVPAWWHSTWSQAKGKADRFAREAGSNSGGYNVFAETKIPTSEVQVSADDSLRYACRLDLLLSSTPIEAGKEIAGGSQRLWDLKTGADKPLKGLKSILRFEGIQLALYVFALVRRGATDVEAAFITDTCRWSPQLTHADVLAPEALNVFERLARMQRTGLFGWTGMVRDRYSPGCRYPMATLAPAANISAKFKATHGL